MSPFHECICLGLNGFFTVYVFVFRIEVNGNYDYYYCENELCRRQNHAFTVEQCSVIHSPVFWFACSIHFNGIQMWRLYL